MKFSTTLLSSLGLVMALAANNLYAAETPTETAALPDVPEHEEHGAHEHGTGTLNITQSEQDIEITLDSPGMNLFGFEYQPKSDADKQAVAAAEAKLWIGANLFGFDEAADCKQTAATLDTTAEDDAHSDVAMSWAFTCTKPDALETVSTKLFSTFSGFHQLNAEWVTNAGASALKLDKDASITLAP